RLFPLRQCGAGAENSPYGEKGTRREPARSLSDPARRRMASGDAWSPARFSTGIADAGTPVTTDGDAQMLRKTLYGILVVLPLAGGLAACDDQGPMEEAGEEIDEA